MGTFSRYNFNVPKYQSSSCLSPQAYKNYIDSLNCPLITSTEANNNYFYIYFGNKFSIVFAIYTGYSMGVKIGNRSVDYVAMCNPWNNHTITVCFSDKTFYLQHNGNYGEGRRMLVVYEEADEKSFLGYIGPGTDSSAEHSWYSIQDLYFTCFEDGLSYRHDSRLKYTHKPDHIDYTVDNLVKGDKFSDIIDTNFVSCSNVTPDSSISFAGQRFYSVGTNILFPIGE